MSEKLKAHIKLCAKDPLWWLLLLCIALSLFFNIRERLGLGTPSKWGGWLCIATGATVLGSCVRKILSALLEKAPSRVAQLWAPSPS